MTRVKRLGQSGLLVALLAATAPVLFLWSHNIDDQIRARDVFMVLVMSWVVVVVVYLAVRFAVADRTRAGLVTALVVVLMSTFGRIMMPKGWVPGHIGATLVLAAFIALGLAGAVLLVRGSFPAERVAQVLNVFLAALIVMNVWTIVGERATAQTGYTAGMGVETGTLRPTRTPRDVYYLIFDRYANRSVLKDLYGFDNEPFLSGLRDRGFVVVDDAIANYPGTTQSLASSLNMTYLDELARVIGADSSDWSPLYRSLHGSVVQQAFRGLGYRTVNIGSWWEGTYEDPEADTNYVYGDLREFNGVFLYTTAVPWITEALQLTESSDPMREQYERVFFQVDAIEEVSRDPDPTFTFAHFTLPHGPYMFDADGGYRAPGHGLPIEEAYLDQLTATNDIVNTIVDTLLASDQDPIIIIQSDEGPNPLRFDASGMDQSWTEQPAADVERKLRILDALYLPGRPPSSVDAPITPVNTFRYIFREYFGGAMPLLDDRTFLFTSYSRPYDYREYTDRFIDDPGGAT